MRSLEPMKVPSHNWHERYCAASYPSQAGSSSLQGVSSPAGLALIFVV